MRPEVTTCYTGMSRRSFVGLGLGAIATGLIAGTTPADAAEGAPFEYMKPDAAHKAALAGDIILVDIRRPEEWLETNVAEGAIGLDMTDDSFVASLVALRRANPETPIALICRTGNRSGYVTTALAKQGFPRLVDVSEGMAGGTNGPGWLKRGLPTYRGTARNVAERTRARMP